MEEDIGYPIQVSTAGQPLAFFLTATSDHITGLTGKAGSVVVKIRKAGGSAVTPSGAITEVDATNMPGWYQVAGNATDSNTLGPMLLHAADAASDPYDDLFPVVAYNPLAATNLGLSALPTASPATSGGLPTGDASGAVKVQSGTGANQISLSSGLVTVGTNNDKTGYALTQAFPANFSALGINASGHVSRVTLADTTTTNTDMRGTDAAALAATALSTAVWTGTKAGFLDAAISSVSTEGASAGDIATAVRSELATELGRIDAAVTTRMATFTYTAPPTAADNLAAWLADADVITLLAVGDALDLMIVDDGAGAYEYTAGALANAPSGGAAPSAADIWTYATRVLTAGTNIVLAKGTGVTGLNDLSAAAVNAEVDTAIADAALATAAALAAAKADTAAILVDTAELQADWADGGRLDLLLDDAAVGGSGGTVTLDLTQTLGAPRALDSVADAAVTVGDALWAATVEMAGDFARSGATLVKKTATGTTVRTLVFDSATAPTSRT